MASHSSGLEFYRCLPIAIKDHNTIHFIAEYTDESAQDNRIEDARLINISPTEINFISCQKIPLGAPVTAFIQFKKHRVELIGKVVRNSAPQSDHISQITCSVGLHQDEHREASEFIRSYIAGMSTEQARDALIQLTTGNYSAETKEDSEVYQKALQAVFSNMHLSIYPAIHQSIANDKGNTFLKGLLRQSSGLLNASSATVLVVSQDRRELKEIAGVGELSAGERTEHHNLALQSFASGKATNTPVPNGSVICHPICDEENKVSGVLQFVCKSDAHSITNQDAKTMIKMLSLLLSNITSAKSSQQKEDDAGVANIVGNSAINGRLRKTIKRIKNLNTSVLIVGEQGVGKALFAKLLHRQGRRGVGPFTAINCQGNDLPNIQAHVNEKMGTLFLQNICALDKTSQRQLATYLQQRSSSELRLVCSSQLGLQHLVKSGDFDPELFEMLSQTVIHIPPLNKRPEDIEALTDHFLQQYCHKQGTGLSKKLSQKAGQQLREHPWPGNVRELKEIIERSVLLYSKEHTISEIKLDDNVIPISGYDQNWALHGLTPQAADSAQPLKRRVALVEREIILREIKNHRGNKSRAARSMGISREALRKKLHKLEGKVESKKSA